MSNSGGQAPALITSGDSLVAPAALPVDAFAYILDDTSSTWRRFLSARSLGDGDAGAYYPAVASRLKAGGNYDVARTPNVFKSVQATAAGSTALWTPGAGKKFRLMGYYVSMTANAGAAGALAPGVDLLDGGGTIIRAAEYFTPAGGGATAGHFTTGAVQLGNGYLSTAANNVLNVSLTNTVTAGSFRAIAWGTEE